MEDLVVDVDLQDRGKVSSATAALRASMTGKRIHVGAQALGVHPNDEALTVT